MHKVFFSTLKLVGVEYPLSVRSHGHLLVQLMDEGCNGSQHQICVNTVYIDPVTLEVTGAEHNPVRMPLGACDGSCAPSLKVGEMVEGPTGWGFF